MFDSKGNVIDLRENGQAALGEFGSRLTYMGTKLLANYPLCGILLLSSKGTIAARFRVRFPHYDIGLAAMQSRTRPRSGRSVRSGLIRPIGKN